MNAIPAMPKHPDATGYLNDLANEINKPWFTMICDLAAVSGMSAIDQPAQDTLFALFTKRASYLGIKPATTAGTGAAPVASIDFLDQLSGILELQASWGCA
ncbi:hypothetical protein LP417_24720 [Polaromonas sp. P1-6]|nr:hypothetical protein LP417_24720 [Polaromonas sp. P1-6]